VPRVEYDLTLVIVELVATVARQANLDGLLAKRRTDLRYRVDLVLPVCRGIVRDASQFHAEYKVWGLNLSNTGVGFLTDQPFEEGAKLTIGLSAFGLYEHVVPSNVVFAKNLVGPVYRVGVNFLFEDE
jgi:hypothetical protein